MSEHFVSDYPVCGGRGSRYGGLMRICRKAHHMACQRMRLLVLGVVIGAVLLQGVVMGSSSAASQVIQRPATITVSFPNLYPPITAIPGKVATGTFYVTDPTSRSVSAHIVSSEVVPQNNGMLTMSPKPNPLFVGDVTLSPSVLTVPAHSTVPVDESVRIPKSLAPNVYLVGVLVVPDAVGDGIKNVGAVGAIMALRVPGLIHNKLTLSWHGPGFWDIAGPASGTIWMMDRGRSDYYAFGQIATTASPGNAVPTIERVQPSLLLGGKWRATAVALHGGFLGLGLFHVHALFEWWLRPNTTAETQLSHTVLIVPVWALIFLAILILAPMAWLWRQRRNKAKAHAERGDGILYRRLWYRVLPTSYSRSH